MKKIFFTVGPSQLYPTVPIHIKKALSENIPSISHRGKQFMNIFETAVNNLRRLMNIPDNLHVFFLSSSLESMERIIANCVEKYSHHFVNGYFSEKFYQTAIDLDKKPNKYVIGNVKRIGIENITIPKQTELICLTQNETSCGMSLPGQLINRLRTLHPDKLMAVDIVSSAPYVSLDFAEIDVAFFSVQKGFGLPAGLGVLIVSDRAIDKAHHCRTYHSFPSLSKSANNCQTPETPNVLNIYLLGKVCQDMLKKGIKNIRRETDIKARMVYEFFDNHRSYTPYIKDRRFRSPTTIAIDVKNQTKPILEKLKTRGLIVGSGYGQFKNTHIRIANFPAHKIADMKRLINIID